MLDMDQTDLKLQYHRRPMAPYPQYSLKLPACAPDYPLHNAHLPPKHPLQDRRDLLGSAQDLLVASLHNKQHTELGSKFAGSECGS